jgi:hypothetical protein
MSVRGGEGAQIGLGRSGSPVAGVAALALAAGFLIAAGPRPAAAEDAEAGTTARARALFTEGLALADRSQWVQAADRFRRSLALRDSPAVRLNLASSLSRQGLDGEAADHLESLLGAGDTPANLRALALRLFAQVEPRTARIAVEVVGVDEGGAEISLDGEALPPWRLGGQLHVDPGSHVVTVEREGRELARREVDLEAGQLEELRVAAAPPPPPELPEPEVVPDEPPAAPAVAPTDERRRRRRRTAIAVGVTGGVAVAAAVVLGVVFGLRSVEDDIVEGNMEPGVWRW